MRRITKKIITILLITVAVFVFAGCDGKTKSGITPLNYVIYEKDGSMYYDAMNGSEAIELTDYAVEGDNEFNIVGHYDSFTTLSKNQKRLFYFSKINRENYNRGTLVYRDVIENGNLSEEYEIDTDVFSYEISDDGNMVLYNKGDDGELLLYDTQTEKMTELDESSYDFHLSSDGKRAIYVDRESVIYEFEIGKEKKKVSKSNSYINSEIKNMDHYYVVGENELYKRTFGGDKKVIADKFSIILKEYENGELYYSTTDEIEVNPADFIVDDMQDDDLKIIENGLVERPEYYPNRENYNSDKEYNDAIQKYNDAVEQNNNFSAMTIRSEIREIIKNNGKITVQKKSYYYYDGQKSMLLADWGTDIYKFSDGMNVSTNSKKPMIVFNSLDEDNIKPVKLSEIGNNIYSAQNVIEEAIDFSYNIMVAENEKIIGEIDCSDISKPWNSDYIFSLDGKKIYMFTQPEVDGHYNIYEIETDSSSVSKPELYDTEVLYPNLVLKNGDFYYTKAGEDEEEFALHKNKEHLGSKSLTEVDAENNRFIMYESVGTDGSGICKVTYYNDGELTDIAENSTWYVNVMENGNIVYIDEYNSESNEGKLYVRTPDGENILLSEKAGPDSVIDIRMRNLDYLAG